MSLSPYEIGLVISLIIQLVIMFKYYSTCNKKFSKFCFGFSSGILSLYPTIYIATHFGGSITINIFTITVASILGLPGTALIAIASLL